MYVQLSATTPKEWQGKKPIEAYETTFLATGFSRYNTTKKTLSNFVRNLDGIWYTESSCLTMVFPRVYACESVRVTVYSRSPMVWAEEIGTDDVHFFVQQPTQTA